MKNTRSASPSQAMPMSAFSAFTRSTMSWRFSSMSGFASWFGNVPSTSMHRPRRPDGMLLEEARRDHAGDAVAGVEDDVERLEDRRIDERQHVLDVVVDDVSAATTRPGVAARAGSRPVAIMSRMSPMPASPLSGNASFRTILMPLYSLGLCDAVIWTPPSWPSRATAK